MKNGSSLEKLTNFLLSKILKFVAYANTNDTINFYSKNYTENYITIAPEDNENTRLYGLSLETSSNCEHKFEMRSIDYNGEVILAYLKHEGVNKIYLYTQNPEIIKTIASDFDINLLNPDEILASLYSVFLIDCFREENKQIINIYEARKDYTFIDNDPLYAIFPQMIKNATANLLRNYEPYQAVSYQYGTTFSVRDMMSAKWEGVVFVMIDFAREGASDLIFKFERNAKFVDSAFLKEIRNLKSAKNAETLDEIYSNTAVINSIAFVRNKTDIDNLEKATKIKYEVRYIGIEKIAARTMIRIRDRDFDFLCARKWASQFIATAIQRDALTYLKGVKNYYPHVDFKGMDFQGGFINYTFRQALAPHALFFGTTRSGKSTAVLKILCQIIDFDFDTLTAKSLSTKRKIRYFNVGYTGGRIFKAIYEQSRRDEKRGKPALMQKVADNINDLHFSLFDFDSEIPTTAEVRELIVFLNLMLGFDANKNNNTYINKTEESMISEAVNNVCRRQASLYNENGDTRESEENPLTIGIIQRKWDGLYADIAQQMLSETDEAGRIKYTINTRISQVSEPKYRMFRKPILSDIIGELEVLEKSVTKKSNEKQACASAIGKLNVLAQNKIYSLYSNVNLKDNTPLYYSELDKIKKDPEQFVAIGWLLMKSCLKIDFQEAIKAANQGLPKPDTYYFFDEGHNFTKQETFKDAFDLLAREAAKFGCHIIFLSQSGRDIEPKVANFFPTQAFLFVNSNKGVTKSEIEYLDEGKALEGDALTLFNKIDNRPESNRTLYMRHTGGISLFQLPAYEDKSEYFDVYQDI